MNGALANCESIKGEVALTIMMDNNFWNGVRKCVKIFSSLVQVLRLVDANPKPAMPSLLVNRERLKKKLKCK